ncbi:M20 aminoacylase family protein [Methylobrevis albus]|uniref:Amidohydrolase n=1 Tax=Methylobrevis albus TaxID=2793297 RepID=A0A931I1E5_9HYPH|nr:M20 aminoacylase family protein [Methylobrevis albus]MBH0238017.1 amidohydrolase [Methylobrevis albus]
MPIVNRIAAAAAEHTLWRRDFHRHPELQYDVHRTAATVAEKLRSFGLDEVVTGVGQTGVVGVLHGRRGPGGRSVGMRADMDALPIREATGAEWSSTVPGKMHACGHDGHTTMLLGAAEYLAETRNFDGTAVFIFQPAEEGGAGAKAMIDDGLFERFPIDEVYGMHNHPGMPVGRFGMRSGPIMAAADVIGIRIEGRGSHAAEPHAGVDPVLAGAAIVQALQQIASRNVDPLQSAVVSVTCFHAGEVDNVLPQVAELRGTVRTLDPAVRDAVEARLKAIIAGIAAAHGVAAEVSYRRGYPVTVNHGAETALTAAIARRVAGDDKVDEAVPPMMGAEDFSYMLERRPGAFILIGNGDSANLHHPAYDFDDAALPYGASYWATLVETALKAA